MTVFNLQTNRGIESDESEDEESENEEEDDDELELNQNDGQVTNRMNINISAENPRLTSNLLEQDLISRREIFYPVVTH